MPTAAPAILERALVPPVRLNPDIPPKVEEIISNALEKDREGRYQSAGEMCADLKRLRRETESGKSVAGESLQGMAKQALAACEDARTIFTGPRDRIGVAAAPNAVANVLANQDDDPGSKRVYESQKTFIQLPEGIDDEIWLYHFS